MALRPENVADKENLYVKSAPLSATRTRRPPLGALTDNVAKKNTKKVSTKVQRNENNNETSTDPQMVPEYVDDIFQYLRELETKYAIKEKFLEGHCSTPKMRAILINWLVRVQMNFHLCVETLYMCVSITDRYLQDNKQVGREQIQLVGTAALYVAAKYEEMVLPSLGDLVVICDNTFSKRDILNMELSILIALDFSLGKPLSIHFLRRYSKLANLSLDQYNLAKYLLELALVDYHTAYIKPSLQAAAAVCLSMSILNQVLPPKVWTSQLTHDTTFKYRDLKPVIIKFAGLLLAVDLSKNKSDKSVQSKYADDSKYNKISTHPKLKGDFVKKLAALSSKS